MMDGLQSFWRKVTGFRQSEEDERFKIKAITMLTKYMSQQNWDELTRALDHLESPAFSNCVPHKLSKDGRMQICGEKVLPHVAACRVWRWADLQSHQQLRSVADCRHQFLPESQGTVCINPAHYSRVGYNIIPAIMVPTNSPLCPTNQNRQYLLDRKVNWGHLTYSEMDKTLAHFQANYESVTVDSSFLDDRCRRFPLGAIVNPSRCQMIEAVRSNIREGIQLDYREGELYVTNKSRRPVFVSSEELCIRKHLGSETIIIVEAGKSANVFSLTEYHKILEMRLFRLSCFPSNDLKALQGICCIQISFFKGWGKDFNRRSVTAMPCWLEIRMEEPLKWLDNIFRQCPAVAMDITNNS